MNEATRTESKTWRDRERDCVAEMGVSIDICLELSLNSCMSCPELWMQIYIY